jgi:hypothetical protein
VRSEVAMSRGRQALVQGQAVPCFDDPSLPTEVVGIEVGIVHCQHMAVFSKAGSLLH